MFEAVHEHISFADIPGLQNMDAIFTACRIGPDRDIIDVIDFSRKSIGRWSMPRIKIPHAVESLRQNIPVEKLPPGITCYEAYCNDHLMRPHVAHLSRDGRLYLCLSDNYNGFCVAMIDTKNGNGYLFPEDFDQNLRYYTSTGNLTSAGSCLFIRWPFVDTAHNLHLRFESVRCEIGMISSDVRQCEIVYALESHDKIHQVACSRSGRYIVFSSFKWDLNVPYPSVTVKDDPEGYRKSHFSGIKTEEIVTVDLQNRRHWRTEITTPVPAHFEFDPVDQDVFYLSAHNMCPAAGGLILEGPAAIYKMRIQEGSTVIEGKYTDNTFFRARQHVLFVYKGHTLIAATNFPNYLDIIDAETMSLWRRIELFSAPSLDFTATGNALCPLYPETCFYINPASGGRYLILGSSKCFSVYDLDCDRLLDVNVPLYLPDGFHDVGHTRSMGE